MNNILSRKDKNSHFHSDLCLNPSHRGWNMAGYRIKSFKKLIDSPTYNHTKLCNLLKN